MTMKKTVYSGIDNIKQHDSVLVGKRIGLITNPTGVNRSLKPTIDILNEEYNLVCMMSPEHGVRGDLQAGDKVETYNDSKTGLPVYSLYGQSCHIKQEIMDTLDVIVFDIQDVGARFYTYMYTLSYAMEDAAKAGKTVVVLDRPNPISCINPQGTVLDHKFASFVGRFEIATRYGMTMGEYALYINSEMDINCNLYVVPLSGYSKDFYYDDTDLFWISPSPNLPTIDSCVCYIGTCLFEGTNMSEGRGTTKPFETIGAPWLKADEVISSIEKYNLTGFKLRETYFKPTFSKHQNELCRGIQIHITDRKSFEPFKLGIILVDTIRRMHDEFEFLPAIKDNDVRFIDLLLGTNILRENDFNPTEFFATQQPKLNAYAEKISKYSLYDM